MAEAKEKPKAAEADPKGKGDPKRRDEPPPLRAPGPGEVAVKAKRAIVVGGVRTAPGAEAVIPSGLAASYGEKYVAVLRRGSKAETDGPPKGDEPPKGEAPSPDPGARTPRGDAGTPE